MEFYKDLSQYYEYIFPLGSGKLPLVKKYLPAGKRVLDVGCGTGELVLALRREGYFSNGVDLSVAMIEKAREEAKKSGEGVDFRVGDMRHLPELYHEPFAGILCFGNTIVHLSGLEDLQGFFQEVADLLEEEGVFLFQIVNYDRIFSQNIRELPLIENEEKKLKFYRMYVLDGTSGLIHFNTRLMIDGEVKAEHSVPLYPLTSNEVRELLAMAGFSRAEFFGNFAQEPYEPEKSMALVVAARKL